MKSSHGERIALPVEETFLRRLGSNGLHGQTRGTHGAKPFLDAGLFGMNDEALSIDLEAVGWSPNTFSPRPQNRKSCLDSCPNHLFLKPCHCEENGSNKLAGRIISTSSPESYGKSCPMPLKLSFSQCRSERISAETIKALNYKQTCPVSSNRPQGFQEDGA